MPILTQIEQELRNQLQPDLEEEYATRAEAELMKIEQQAEEEFQEALAVLEQEFEQLKAEKEGELQQELLKHQQAFQEREKTRLAQAQERFLQEHFDDRIMAHPSMTQLEQALEAEVAEAMASRMAATREKRLKEVRVRLEGR